MLTFALKSKNDARLYAQWPANFWTISKWLILNLVGLKNLRGLGVENDFNNRIIEFKRFDWHSFLNTPKNSTVRWEDFNVWFGLSFCKFCIFEPEFLLFIEIIRSPLGSNTFIKYLLPCNSLLPAFCWQLFCKFVAVFPALWFPPFWPLLHAFY